MAKYRLTSGEYFEGFIVTVDAYDRRVLFPTKIPMARREILAKLTKALPYDGFFLLAIRYRDVNSREQLVYDTADHPFTERAYEDSRIIYENI